MKELLKNTQRVLSSSATGKVTGFFVPDSDDIMRIKAGTIRAGSIRFRNASYRCSVCGTEIVDRACSHLSDKNNNAYLWIDNAKLVEHSLVSVCPNPGMLVRSSAKLSEDTDFEISYQAFINRTQR